MKLWYGNQYIKAATVQLNICKIVYMQLSRLMEHFTASSTKGMNRIFIMSTLLLVVVCICVQVATSLPNLVQNTGEYIDMQA